MCFGCIPIPCSVLAGDGELREELEKRAQELGIAASVRFVGYRHDIPDLLAAADVVAHAAHTEGLCSSLIDAMMCGKPIVATTAGGIPDLLEADSAETKSDGQIAARMVGPRSSDELASAINAVLLKPRSGSRDGAVGKAPGNDAVYG